MAGLLDPASLEQVLIAWRRALRVHPLLSRALLPDLRPFAEAFNIALSGEDDDELTQACDDLVAANLDATTVIGMTAALAETVADELGVGSGAATRSLISTFGRVCGLLSQTMVDDAAALAFRDPLTGLENRRAWDAKIDEMVSDGGPFAVAIIDLDGLKAVNDAGGGHAAGDAYLRTFASALADAMPSDSSSYRFAGDEYSVVFPATDSETAANALVKLQEDLTAMPFSYGIASVPSDAGSSEQIKAAADQRMYAMKAVHHGDAPAADPAGDARAADPGSPAQEEQIKPNPQGQ